MVAFYCPVFFRWFCVVFIVFKVERLCVVVKPVFKICFGGSYVNVLTVSSIESTNEELMYTIRRENHMTHEVMQTLIEETKKATNVTKAPLEKNSTTINITVQQCKNELKTGFRETIAATLKIQNNKDEVKNAKKNIEETWNEKLKKRDDIFWRYYRNKGLN